MSGTGSGEPTLRAFGEFTRPAQGLILDQYTRPPKVKIPTLFLKDSQATRKEGSRMEEKEEGEIRDISTGEHRYVEIPTDQSPSPLFSIFDQPLILGGSSGLGGSLDTINLEPLRVVEADGSEWGLENSRVMVEAVEGHDEDRQRTEEVQTMSSEGSVYENWENSCSVKFSEFLGFSMVGFEKKILGLMRKMVAMQQNNKKKGVVTVTRCEQELKKLENAINYNGM